MYNISSVFPGWEIVRQLGSGSYGQVYEIQRNEYNHIYKSALKIIRIPSKGNSDGVGLDFSSSNDKNFDSYYKGLVQNLSNEISVMDDLKSCPNIVRYEDHKVVKQEDNRGYIIFIRMELLTSLKEYSEKKDCLSEQEVLRLGIDLCNALEVCHARNLIHRDIKPANIFVNENGVFKLGDFGVARTMEEGEASMTRTGTSNYMAPEVLRGHYDETADIYSLGMVLYILLNDGLLPFISPEEITPDSYISARMKRLSGNAVPPPSNASELTKHVICKALEFNPNKRFRNATALKNALNQCISPEKQNYSSNRNDSPKKTASPFISPEHSDTTLDIVSQKASDDLPLPKAEKIEEQQTKPKTFKWVIGGIAFLILFILVLGIFLKQDKKETNTEAENTVLEQELEDSKQESKEKEDTSDKDTKKTESKENEKEDSSSVDEDSEETEEIIIEPKEKTTEEPKEETEVTVNIYWKDSYSEFLNNYQDSQHAEAPRYILPCIDGDLIPEIVIFDSKDHLTNCSIFTFYDNEVIKLGEFTTEYGSFSYAEYDNIFLDAYAHMGYTETIYFTIADDTLVKYAEYYYSSKNGIEQYAVNGIPSKKEDFEAVANGYNPEMKNSSYDTAFDFNKESIKESLTPFR